MASSINADDGVISGSSGLKSTADASGVLALQTNGTTAVTIDTSQKVGIGTTSPLGTLGVAGSATTTIVIPRSSNGTTASPVETQLIGSTFTNGSYGAGVYALNSFTDTSANWLTFKTTAAGNGSPVERFRIAQDGQLGIGGANYGTSGQVLTSAGSGSAPTWTTPSAGAMTLISTATVSNAASVSFTSLTNSYTSYLIVLYNVYNTGTGGYPLYMQVSTDNSTYLSSNYFWSSNGNTARPGSSGSSGQDNNFAGSSSYDSQIKISNNGSGGSGSVVSVTGEIKLFNPGGGTRPTVIHSRVTSCDSTPTFGQDIVYSANTTTSAIQAVKLYFSVGNIWGTFKLYGIT